MARIHPTAIVETGAELGEDVEIGPYCIVKAHVKLGASSVLQSHVVLEDHTEIGAGATIHPFANLGGPPQHQAYRGEPTRLVIGPRATIREHATAHLGTPGGRQVTVIGSDVLLMAGSHVGHDCVLGDSVILAQGASLGGHVQLGDFVIVGGGAALHQGTRVGRHGFVGGMAGVHRDIIPFGSVYGNPAHIEGLNLIGLKRRGVSREAVNKVRAAVKSLFGPEGTLHERVEATAAAYAGAPEVDEILAFIRAEAGRPICQPKSAAER